MSGSGRRRNVRDSIVLLEDNNRIAGEDGSTLSPPGRSTGRVSLGTPLSPLGEGDTSVFSPNSSLTPTQVDKASELSAKEEKYRRAIADSPNDVNALSKFGIFLKNVKKDIDGAEEMYKAALKVDPKHLITLCRYGVLLQSVRKDYDGAADIYQRVLDIDPKHVGILYNYGCLLEDVKRDYDGAEEKYKAVLAEDPQHVAALRIYGRLLHQVRRDIAGAEKMYKAVLRLDATDLSTLNRYGVLLHLETGDYDKAEEMFKRVLEIDPSHVRTLGNYAFFVQTVRNAPERAGELYRQALAIDPGHEPTLTNYTALQQGKAETPIMDKNVNSNDEVGAAVDPEAIFKEVLASNPSAGVHANYAKWLQDVKGDFLGAKDNYCLSIDLDKQNITTLLNYGELLEEHLKDYDEAESCYEMALEVNVNHVPSLFRRARLMDKVRHEFSAAMGVYENILKLDHEHIPTLSNLSNIYEHVFHDLDRCEAMHKTILEIDPNHVDTLLHYGVFLHEHRNNDSLAADMYSAVLALDPKNVSGLYNLGVLLDSQGNLSGAEKTYLRALEVDEKHVPTLSAYGLLLHNRKDDIRAEERYLQALEEDPHHVSTLYNLGCLLKEAEDHKSAMRAQQLFERILAIDRSHIPTMLNYAVLLFSRKLNYTGEDTNNKLISGYHGAELMFQRILRIDPSNVVAIFNYSGMLFSTLPKLGINVIVPATLNERLVKEGKAMCLKLLAMPDSKCDPFMKQKATRLMNSYLKFEKDYEVLQVGTVRTQEDEMKSHVVGNFIADLVTPMESEEVIQIKRRKKEEEANELELAIIRKNEEEIAEQQRIIEQQAQLRLTKLKVRNALERCFLYYKEEQTLWAFRVWKRLVHDQKLSELQAAMDAKSTAFHREEILQTPSDLAAAAFSLSEHLRKKRDKVVADVRSGHHVAATRKPPSPEAIALRYRVVSSLVGYEAPLSAECVVETALQQAEENFEFSERKRKERMEVQHENALEELRLLKRIAEMVKEVASTDDQGHDDMCDKIISTLGLDDKRLDLVYHEMLKVDGTNLYTLNKYANYLYDVKGDKAAAIDVYEKAISIDSKYARTFSNYGIRLYSLNSFVQAEKMLKIACEMNENDAAALCQYAVLFHVVKGDVAMAEVKFKEALKRDPYNEKALFSFAVMLKELKRLDEAGQLYSTLITRNPTLVPALHNYAIVLYEAKDYKKAEVMFERVLKVDEGHVSCLLNFAYMLFNTLPKMSSRVFLSPYVSNKLLPRIRKLIGTLKAMDSLPGPVEVKLAALDAEVNNYMRQIEATVPDCPLERENNSCISGFVDLLFPTKKKSEAMGGGVKEGVSDSASCFFCC